MSCLVIVNLKFLLDWSYLFILTFKLRNSSLQLLIQIFASLTCQRYDFIPTHESEESKNANETENGKIINENDVVNTLQKVEIEQNIDQDENKVEENNHSHKSEGNRYKIDDGKFIYFFKKSNKDAS